MKHLITAFAFLFFCKIAIAQGSFIFGGGGIGYGSNSSLNQVVNDFNFANEHSVSSFNTVPSYELGIVHYGKTTSVEVKWGGQGKRNSSKVPGNFIENATVAWRYHYLNLSFGVLPYKDTPLSLGAGVNFGKIRTRYSFGGDFLITDENFLISSDIFLDYTLKVRWRRSRKPYLFRIRPYYQFFFLSNDLKELEEGLNNTPDVLQNEIQENFSHFGIRFALMIPLKPNKKRTWN